MNDKSKPPKPIIVIIDRRSDENMKGALKDIGGSKSDNWNHVLGQQATDTLWTKNSDPEMKVKQLNATVAALIGIAPQDELEAMMAAQLIAAHNGAMECYRRSMIGEQTFEGRQENLIQANKLSRTYASLIEAFTRYRGRGHQKIVVEHVHVYAGGQAVVGMVGTPGGGGRQKVEEQSHARQIAHAPEPTLPSPHPGGDVLPTSRDEERPLPDARRPRARRAKGQ